MHDVAWGASSDMDSEAFSGDVLVVPFYKPVLEGTEKSDDAVLGSKLVELIPQGLSAEVKLALTGVLQEGSFKADVGGRRVVAVAGLPVKYLALVGLGAAPKVGSGTGTGTGADMEVTSSNRLGKALAGLAKETSAKSMGVVLPGIANAGVSTLMGGFRDAAQEDTRYKKVPEGGHKSAMKLESLRLLGVSAAVAADIATTATLSDYISSGVLLCKDLVNAPPNSKTPVAVALVARKIADDHDLKATILDADECEALGMGAYLGVQSGSMYPPRFVHLTYKPKNGGADVPKVALVGKGLTFDSGGYNIKAGGGSMIELMKFDMGGCGSVLGAAKAIGQLKPQNVEVHFITALCENMVSSEAMKPGDILTAMNGKTIEVLNTDAEGRLTLADALCYAEQKTGASTIIDLATLTGAVIVALGDKYAALYTRDDALKIELEGAAKRADELVWSMPLASEYKDRTKAPLADLKNIAAGGGGSITAALFLEQFVDSPKWAHIDMAGPVWNKGSNSPTGWGVKLLVDYLLNVKK
jgi:leucyl aminopeptidase